MIGIVIATHGGLSEGFKDAAEVVAGETQNIITVNLNAGDNVDNLGVEISKAIHEVNDGDGVIILTDLLSASPYNQSMIAINNLAPELQSKLYIITGANFPMLLEAINAQLIGTDISEAVNLVVEQGKEGIISWHVSHNNGNDDDDDDF